MVFDIQTFKRHYASDIIRLMYIEVLVFVIAIIVRIVNISSLFALSVLMIGLIPIVVLPLTFCYYIRMKKQAERQKQWFSNGKLYVERCQDSGLTAGGFVDHRETVLFERIDTVEVKKRYIVLSGEITVVERYNGVSKERQVKSYGIPRTFLREEEIINVGGMKNV